MKLTELINELERIDVSGNTSINISSIEYDSRKVKPGSLFAAIKGFESDGNSFIGDAVRQGAVAILTDKPDLKENVAVLYVPDVRKALAVISNAFYGKPQEKLIMTAVTGTNGKTTTSYMIQSIFETGGIGCGLIGTIHHSVGDEILTSVNTTPESSDIHSFLAQMTQSKQSACVMEVSSHALALSRVHGIRFRAAAYTNLSRDHLDFHGDFKITLRRKAFSSAVFPGILQQLSISTMPMPVILSRYLVKENF